MSSANTDLTELKKASLACYEGQEHSAIKKEILLVTGTTRTTVLIADNFGEH